MRYCTTCGARFSQDLQFCPNDGSPTQELEEAGPPKDPLLGRVIDGRYRIESQIGEGGMGIVYLASHTVLGKKLALKVLRGDMAKDQDVVTRFIQEAQSATSIGHQNIIDISDFGRLPDGTAYFVMEYLDGQPLTDLVRQGGSVPMQDALGIIRQIAAALGAAHQRGIVHRDMKPDNVFLIKRGGSPYFVKVLDFGIAKVGGAASKLTKTGMVFGTPHYMAPEQAAGQSVDHRTDIYALGVIMYEMFTGKVPFDADTFMGILSKHMFEPPVPPSAQAGAPKLGAIEDVILKALAKKPEQRYQTMEALIADLDQVASGGQIKLGGTPGVPPPDNLADALEPPSRTEMRLSSGGTIRADSAMGSKKSRVPLIIGLLFALVVLGGGVATAMVVLAGEDTDGGEGPVVTALPTTTLTDVRDAGGAVAAPPPDTTVAEVEVRSVPPGAEVLVEGAIIGNTPTRMRRPEEGNAREIELRMNGRESQIVRITHESTDVVEVTLRQAAEEPEETGTRHSMRQGTGSSMETRTMTETTETTTMMTTSVPTNDVVDPWADP
jgi:serine/threonine-protein kinase